MHFVFILIFLFYIYLCSYLFFSLLFLYLYTFICVLYGISLYIISRILSYVYTLLTYVFYRSYLYTFFLFSSLSPIFGDLFITQYSLSNNIVFLNHDLSTQSTLCWRSNKKSRFFLGILIGMEQGLRDLEP